MSIIYDLLPVAGAVAIIFLALIGMAVVSLALKVIYNMFH